MAVQVSTPHLIDFPGSAVTPAEVLYPAGGDAGLDLQAVVALAAAAISKRTGSCDCGISVVTARGVHDTLASTSDVPARFDGLQRQLGQGPGLDPVQSAAVIYSPDLSMDGRWPELASMCGSVVEVRSLMQVEIPVVDGGRAMMSFYSAEPAVFNTGHMVRAARFARFAAPSVQRVLRLQNSADQEAASGNHHIATALGVVMARYRVASSRAFEMLRDSADALRVEVLDLAIDVIRSGRLPARQIAEARRGRRALQVAPGQ